MLVIAVVALLVLGPKRLPELARGIGKFLREFRRQTDDVRGVVEREFYRMDLEEEHPTPKIAPGESAVPQGSPDDGPEAQPEGAEPETISQVTAGMPRPAQSEAEPEPAQPAPESEKKA